MWVPDLSDSDRRALEDAMLSPYRRANFRAELLDKDGDPVPSRLILVGGGVTVDATRPKQEPTRTAEFELIDSDRRLKVDWRGTRGNDIWFSKQLRAIVDLWVPDFDDWYPIPLFTGPVFRPSVKGEQVTVSCYGRDAQHLDDYKHYEAFTRRKHARVSAVIKEGLQDRGERFFRFTGSPDRLKRDFTKVPGEVPWKGFQNLAEDIDRQLYCDGEGTFVLREISNAPVVTFEEGRYSLLREIPTEDMSIERVFDTVIVRGERHENRKKWIGKLELDQKVTVGATQVHLKAADNVSHLDVGKKIKVGGRGSNAPEQRTISGSYTPGSRTVPVTKAFSNAHGIGAPVEVYTETDVTIRVFGKSSLPDSDALSAQSLTGGRRRKVKLIDRPGIHKKDKAQDTSDRILDRIKNGIEIEAQLSIIPWYLLEEGDVFMFEMQGRLIRTRARTFYIPFTPSDPMTINASFRRRARRHR